MVIFLFGLSRVIASNLNLFESQKSFKKLKFVEVLYEKACFIEHSLRRGPSGPSSLAPATQDKMHFYNNPMVMICATVNALTLL